MPGSRRRKQQPDPLRVYQGFNFQVNKNIKGDNCPRVFFTVCLFKCPCNSEWSEWESPLSLAEEGEYCENPECKGNAPILPYDKITEAKTSCQNPDLRVVGSFLCHKCGRNWQSAHSWTNKWQKCEFCKITIYPFAQDDWEKPRVSNGTFAHLNELCQMCTELGHGCPRLKIKKKKNRRRIRTAHKKIPQPFEEYTIEE